MDSPNSLDVIGYLQQHYACLPCIEILLTKCLSCVVHPHDKAKGLADQSITPFEAIWARFTDRILV